MKDQTASQIYRDINVPTSIIRRTLKFGGTRHNRNLTSETSQKINARDLRQLVRAIISFSDNKRAFYLQIAEELRIIVFVFIIRRAFRKAGFRRYIAYLKLLVL